MASMKTSLAAGVAALFALPLIAAAQDSHREHGAHEHGSGALGVVLVGIELAIELRMPGVNVVGFEHAPATDEDRATVEQALAVFRDPSRLYLPSADAGCSVVSAEASLDLPAEGEQAEHAELIATSLFECASPERLQQIEIMAFEHLLDVEDLDAQVVTEQSQGEVELSPGQPVLPLGGS